MNVHTESYRQQRLARLQEMTARATELRNRAFTRRFPDPPLRMSNLGAIQVHRRRVKRNEVLRNLLRKTHEHPALGA